MVKGAATQPYQDDPCRADPTFFWHEKAGCSDECQHTPLPPSLPHHPRMHAYLKHHDARRVRKREGRLESEMKAKVAVGMGQGTYFVLSAATVPLSFCDSTHRGIAARGRARREEGAWERWCMLRARGLHAGEGVMELMPSYLHTGRRTPRIRTGRCDDRHARVNKRFRLPGY